MKILIKLVPRKIPNEFTQLQDAAEAFYLELIKGFRIPQIVEWLNDKLTQ